MVLELYITFIMLIMTFLMVVHSPATLIPGTLPTLNLSIKSLLHQGSCVFPEVILVSNYHSYKRQYYHTTVSVEVIFPKKNRAPFSGSPPQKYTKPPGSPFSSIPLKNVTLYLP